MSWPSNRGNADYRSILQYLGRACLSCGKGPSSGKALLRCTRCQRAWYCDPQCQKTDYPAHHPFCKAYLPLKDWTFSLDTTPNQDPHIDRLSGEDGVTPRQDALDAFATAFVYKGMGALLVSLGSKRTKVANYLAYLTPRCLWCYRINSSQHTLIVCETCHVASWCAGSECEENGRRAHEGDHCTLCCILVRDDEYILNSKDFSVLRYRTTRLLTSSSPAFNLASFSGWDSYISTLDLPDHLARPEVIDTIVTRQLSLPLTILSAMERFGLLAKFQGTPENREHETLRIHLIGAEEQYEILAGSFAAEELLHVLPNVKRLEWIAVGPELGKLNDTDKNIANLDCCSDCESAGRKIQIGWYNTRYQTFATSTNEAYRQPHLAVGFNSGMHERPQSWGPVLDLLHEQHIPSVFTSYSLSEAQMDAQVVEKSNIKLDWKEEGNKWRGERMQWDWFIEGNMWWENGWWMGFK